MIYICKACNCSVCNKACDSLCAECRHCCDPFCQVYDRPLGGYVLMTAILNAPATILAAVSVPNEEVRSCESHPLAFYCAASAMVGVIHVGFALYLQRRLVYGLAKEEALAANGSVPGAAPEEPSSKDLMYRAAFIVLYDIGFCLYFFVFVLSFGLHMMGFSYITGCGVNTSWPWFGAVLQVLYAIGAVCFAFLWYAAMACDSCCGYVDSSSRVLSGVGPGRKENTGITRLIFGKGGSNGSSGKGLFGMGPSVFGVKTAPARPGSVQPHPTALVGAYAPTAQVMSPQAPTGVPPPYHPGGPPGAHAPLSSQPPSFAPGQRSGAATQMAAGGLTMAGNGISALGRAVGGGQNTGNQSR